MRVFLQGHGYDVSRYDDVTQRLPVERYPAVIARFPVHQLRRRAGNESIYRCAMFSPTDQRLRSFVVVGRKEVTPSREMETLILSMQ